MNALKDGWFSEVQNEHYVSMKLQQLLYHEASEFQDIVIFESKSNGRVLALDGMVQCSELDEFAYQEMITFIPLCCHPDPKKVLIVGGGDGGVAREVSKHPGVSSADLVEIDEAVMAASKRYLPRMAEGLSHPKLTVHVGDGLAFMERRRNAYDVIITDSSDPVGPAVALFQRNYFELMKNALKPGGIVCSQAGSIWDKTNVVTNTVKVCREVFPSTAYAYTSVPTYPDGQIGFVIGGLEKEIDFKVPKKIFTENELTEMDLKYYNSEVHRAAFVLPRFAILDT